MDKGKKLRKRLSAEERKREILKHSFDLISQKGFKSASTRDIAKAAGINEALIYNYYPTKDDLLRAVISDIINKQPMHECELAVDEVDFRNKLLSFVDFFIGINLKNPAIIKIMLYACLEDFPLPDEFNFKEKGTFLNWLYESIEKGKKDWGFSRNNNSLVYISSFMGGLIYFILQTSVTKFYNELIDSSDFKESFIDAFIKSLK